MKLFVHSAENLSPASDVGFLGTDATRCAYVTFSIANKQVCATTSVTSLNPSWKEFFQFRWNNNNPELAQHIYLELWDKGRRVGGDEFIAKCRIPLKR
jgi:hypothetical protein